MRAGAIALPNHVLNVFAGSLFGELGGFCECHNTRTLPENAGMSNA